MNNLNNHVGGKSHEEEVVEHGKVLELQSREGVHHGGRHEDHGQIAQHDEGHVKRVHQRQSLGIGGDVSLEEGVDVVNDSRGDLVEELLGVSIPRLRNGREGRACTLGE